MCPEKTDAKCTPACQKYGGQRVDITIVAAVQSELADLHPGIDIAGTLETRSERQFRHLVQRIVIMVRRGELLLPQPPLGYGEPGHVQGNRYALLTTGKESLRRSISREFANPGDLVVKCQD